MPCGPKFRYQVAWLCGCLASGRFLSLGLVGQVYTELHGANCAAVKIGPAHLFMLHTYAVLNKCSFSRIHLWAHAVPQALALPLEWLPYMLFGIRCVQIE